MKTKYMLSGLLVLAGMTNCTDSTDLKIKPGMESPTVSIGQTMPAWKEGCLDIHFINTGRGESTFYIFPDATTMLVDAAGSLLTEDDIPPTPAKPNASITSGRVIADYVDHFAPETNKKLDYLLLTHYDTDHMGSYSTTLPQSAEGGFGLSGITEVGALLRFDKLIDRGYTYPKDRSSESRFVNYIKFIDWSKTAYGASYEEFAPGRNDQIALKHDPAKYGNFEIRNLFSNGVVWAGSGSETRNTFPSATVVNSADPAENIFSIAFRLKYGRFDFFAGGDLQYNDRSTYAWKDVEAPIAEVMGAVEVMKANHHGTSNTNSDVLLNKMMPRTVLIHTWRDVHPNPETIGRMYTSNGDCKIFLTNLTEANKVRLSNFISRLSGTQGHIVVRVNPDELFTYCVYVLDDSNESYLVKSAFGPYFSNN